MHVRLLTLVLSGAIASCGAKTGLRDLAAAGPDASAADPICRTLRVRANVGAEVTLRAEVDHAPPRATGFDWSLRRGPRGSRATLLAADADRASLTPDVPGAFEVVVTTPHVLANGERLQCGAVVTVEPADPRCPDFALREPSVVALPGSTQQFGFAPSWSPPRVQASAGTVASDDVAQGVAALLWEFEATQGLTVTADAVEGRVVSVLGATPVLVGREGDTAGGLRYRRSSFRVGGNATAGALRDRVAQEVAGLAPGASREGFGVYDAFVVEVTTVHRPAEGRAVMVLAAAPEALYIDPRRGTATTLRDVTNTSGLSPAGAPLDVVCQRVDARRRAAADFLWLVDTSESMYDDQERLGDTAYRFFSWMSEVGVDFRVGVVEAGSAPNGPDLDAPGFAWISGADPMGPQRLAWEVTGYHYRLQVADRLGPYPLGGTREEPVAAGIVTTLAMERHAPRDPDARRSFRPGVQRVAFFVSDEFGENDDARFFALDPARWGQSGVDRVRGAARWYAERDILTFGMVNIYGGGRCPSVWNLPACVALATGGAYIPMETARNEEVASAMSRIVDAIAGATSEFTLARPPVSSTLQVMVDRALVPRSNGTGFDWDDSARAIVFRGATHRPRGGQTVRAAYLHWGDR